MATRNTTRKSVPRHGSLNPNWKGGGREQKCERCGSQFWVNNTRVGKARFCSLACFNVGQREGTFATKGARKLYVAVNCLWCDECFEVPPSHAARRRFCSPPCHAVWRASEFKRSGNPNWRGGLSQFPYPPDWRKVSEAMKTRDGHRCLNPECFGGVEALNVHHIDYDKNNCDPANLITLCCACNGRANFGRLRWMRFYQSIQSVRGIIPSSEPSALPREPEPKGRKGVRHHFAKLTDEMVRTIRERRAAGTKGRELAREFGVSEATVSNIVHGKNWGHV